MTPLADTHVHLLAGRDDGPETLDEAVAMCRMLVADGARHATALAHQNEHYPQNSAEQLRADAAELTKQLASRQIPLSVYPTGEVMLSASIVQDWQSGQLLSVGDRGQWLLVEMPHGMFVDLLPIAEALRPLGIRPIVAHAERYPELLDDPGLTAEWIKAGCLIQVTSRASPTRGIRRWNGRSNGGLRAGSFTCWGPTVMESTGAGRCLPGDSPGW